MTDPNQPAAQAPQGSAVPPGPGEQQKADQTPPVAAPVTAPARQDNREVQAMIGRLVNERNTLRTENKLLSDKVSARLEGIESILKALAPAIASGAAPGTNQDLTATIENLSKAAGEKTATIDKNLSDTELKTQSDQAADSAFGVVDALLSPIGVDMNDLKDPDIQAIKAVFDSTYLSGSLDYSKMIMLAVQIANNRRSAPAAAPAQPQQTVGDIEAKLKEAEEKGKKTAIEEVKKMAGARHDLPGVGGTGALVTDDMERRRQAIAKARENL